MTRRNFFTKAAAAAAGASVANSLVASARADDPTNSPQQESTKSPIYDQGDTPKQFPPGEPGKDYAPVITPNGTTLPYKIVDGVKIFHLIPGEVDHEFAQDFVLVAGGSMARFIAQPLRLWRGTVCAFT